MENGLEISIKKFCEIEKIHSLEFIDNDEKLLIISKNSKDKNKLKFMIWDIYNTGKVETIMLDDYYPTIDHLDTRFARTSGNILQVDDKGNVISVLKKVENIILKQKQSENIVYYSNDELDKKYGKTLDGKLDENHVIYFDKNQNFEQIVEKKEPWVMEDYERTSYCLYHNKKGTETETLQLIVGRTTVQIWHQIHSDPDNKEDLPNKGEPFLEYIWTNGIPVDQEREVTRLRVEEFKCRLNNGSNDNKLNNFYLKVYWYERVREGTEKTKRIGDEMLKKLEDNELKIKEMKKMKIVNDEETRKLKMEIEEIENEMKKFRKEKVIQWKDIAEKVNAVRHACKALEHLNKRAKYKKLVNYIKIHRVSVYIEYTVFTIYKYYMYRIFLLMYTFFN